MRTDGNTPVVALTRGCVDGKKETGRSGVAAEAEVAEQVAAVAGGARGALSGFEV